MAPFVPSAQLIEAQKITLARLAKIQDQFNNSPGSGRLNGKVAILTGVGSTKGIGRATAILFAKEGARHLYLLDFHAEHLPALAKEIEKRYPHCKITTIEGDAADEKLISSLCQRAITEEGRLDGYFANAGISGAHFLASTEPEEFLDMFRINTLSCFLAVKHASEAMKIVNKSAGKHESGGSIVMTASVAGMRSGAGPIDYSASKAAVINLAYTSAQVLAGTNIRVNSICPGLIESGMTEFTFSRAQERGTLGKVGQLNPLKRFGIAEEIAPAVLFLTSDESSYVNGIHLPVDGGLSSSHPIVPGHFH